jgi:separase
MDATASSLLASLQQGADYRGLYSRFSSYLQPFSDLVALDFRDPSIKKKPTPRRKTSQSSAIVRPLAKRFLSFICKALSLLPTLVRETSNGDRIEERDNELLGIYALILDCLGCLLPVLDGEPYMLHLHRGVFLRRLVATGKYEKAEFEAVVLLEDLVSALVPDGKVSGSRKGKGTVAEPQILLPDPQVVDGDHTGITTLVIDIIASLCDCAFNSKSKRPEAYMRILALVEQVQPWIR